MRSADDFVWAIMRVSGYLGFGLFALDSFQSGRWAQGLVEILLILLIFLFVRA